MTLKQFLMLFFVLQCFFAVSTAIVCKCTKSSSNFTCSEEETCEVEDGFCLMLNHPNLGRRYACHTRGLARSCTTRTAKSGADVEVCTCNDYDFCNSQLWPSDEAETVQQRMSQSENNENSNSVTPFLFPCIFSLLLLRFQM